ncbi:MAG: transglycosylase SLT domain-containing protein [Pyrinomonadaceae bacterium]
MATTNAPDHLAKGQAFLENRQFPQAREHFFKILELFPTDPGLAQAVFGIGRSFMWERSYDTAIVYLDRAAREFPGTRYGEDGLSFKGASLVRLGKHSEAASVYQQYVTMYPVGERVESAHTNIIDALREAGKYDDANSWVDKTLQKFPGEPVATNAMNSRLRMEIYRERWPAAIATSDAMIGSAKFAGTITSMDEVKFLKGLALEKSGNTAAASATYSTVTNSLSSYFGTLASERLASIGSRRVAPLVTAKQMNDSPVVFRGELLQYSKKHDIDPRFLLAIMKQESGFRPDAKSPASARGLLQLVYDTAIKYNTAAGIGNIQPDDLFVPRTNIAIGTEYIAALKKQFGGLYEAIAASYNAGEDNAERWLARSKPKEAGVFAAEVGFAETKNYVFKVMTNYRIYQEIYDKDLKKK